jgi:hypothetical protein
MLRRGFDFHFRYANFGLRNLMIRLAHGLPDPKAAAHYCEEDSLHFLKDKQGPGGILCLQPFYESGHLDSVSNPDEFLDRLLPLRAELLDGDLRPLYLAHLAVVMDGNHDPDEEEDAPVPAGLATLTDAQDALAELYELSSALVAAAAENSPPLPERPDPENRYAPWIKRQPATTKDAWLARLMADPRASVRRELLAAFQESQGAASWPAVKVVRTISELQAAAKGIQTQMDRAAAEAAAHKRAKKLADLAADPVRTLRDTEELVKKRSIDAYDKIARQLADLREALSGSDRSALADDHARKLKEKNPKLLRLSSALRRQGFLK